MSDISRADEIAEDMRERIASGEYPAGERLASERDLANQFNVSRETMRRAIQMLQGEELIVRRGALGTFVKPEMARVEVIQGQEVPIITGGQNIVAGDELARVGSFAENMKRVGRNPTITFLEPVSLIAADSGIAAHLDIGQNALVLRRYRVQGADGIPYRIIESFYPADLFGELIQTDIGSKPLFKWLQERHKRQVQHAEEILAARLPSPNERKLLKISSASPVVDIERTVRDQEKRIVEWARIVAVGALYTFRYGYDIAWEK